MNHSANMSIKKMTQSRQEASYELVKAFRKALMHKIPTQAFHLS